MLLTDRTLLLDVIEGGQYGVLSDIETGEAVPMRIATSNDGQTITLFLDPPPSDTAGEALDRAIMLAARDHRTGATGAPSVVTDGPQIEG